jgi:hypothetical protein
MAQIYNTAQRVIVWLGESSRISELSILERQI